MVPRNGSPVGIAAGLIKSETHVPPGLGEVAEHITFGSFTLEPRPGNAEPTYYFDPETGNSINAVNLKNQGLEAFFRDDLPKLTYLRDQGCRIRVSLAPLKNGDLRQMIECIWDYRGKTGYVVEFEINGACPNHRDQSGQLHAVLAKDPDAVESLLSEADTQHARLLTLAFKIALRTPASTLKSIAYLMARYGFKTLVSGNTILESSIIGGKKRLSVDKGGMAGAILYPDALKQIETLQSIIESDTDLSELRLLPCGGIMTVANARSYLNMGIPFVQVATYFAEYGVKGIRDLVQELV